MIQDRHEAGKLLAEKLSIFLKGKTCVLLTIPRGGVVVGAEISKTFKIPLDVIISKKVTPPEHPEYAIGAMTHDGVIYRGPNWEQYSSEPGFEIELQKKKNEVKRRIEAYRGSTVYDLENKTVILVDDGIATGATVFAILDWLTMQKPSEIILAIPVIPFSTHEELKKFKIKIIALEIPRNFSAVGQFFRKFDQVQEQTVLDLIQKHKSI